MQPARNVIPDDSSPTRIPIVSDILDRYDQLWKSFIRPSRRPYPLETLGPMKRQMDDMITYDRIDDYVLNHRSLKLEYTLYQIRGPPRRIQKGKILIYLHAHSAGRKDGIFLLENAYKLGLSVCVFDFSGSGLSEGEYVTLGYEEHKDIESILKELRMNYSYQNFIFWGRSMGAVAALLHAEKNPNSVDFMVLDSPFSSVLDMIQDTSATYLNVPEFVIKMAVNVVLDSCKDRIGYDLTDLKPIDAAKKIRKVPALFASSKSDELVLYTRVKSMYDEYKGPKFFHTIKGSHVCPREPEEILAIFQCIAEHCNRADAFKWLKKPSYPITDPKPDINIFRSEYSSHGHTPVD